MSNLHTLTDAKPNLQRIASVYNSDITTSANNGESSSSDFCSSPEQINWNEGRRHKSQFLPTGSCEKELFDVELSPNSVDRRAAMRFLNVAVPLDSLKDEVDRLGGIEAVTREKRWCEVARSLGLDTARHTSASTRLRLGLESYASRTASGESKRIRAENRSSCVIADHHSNRAARVTKKRGKNGSDLRGVIRRNGGGWHARLYVPLSLRTPGFPMRIFLGPCKSREEAAMRCDNKLIQLFGRARAHRYLNFPDLATACEPDLDIQKKHRVQNKAGFPHVNMTSDSPISANGHHPSSVSQDFLATSVKGDPNSFGLDESGVSDGFETQNGVELNQDTSAGNDALLAVWKMSNATKNERNAGRTLDSSKE